MEVSSNKLSFIEASEEPEAKEFIEKQLGFPAPRPAGYHLYVKLYIREEDVHTIKDKDGNAILDSNGKPMYIALPETSTRNDKYRSCTALVISTGPEAHKGERFKESGPWCRVGDWAVIPRHEGIQVNYRGIPMMLIPDDRILSVIEDPSYVTRD